MQGGRQGARGEKSIGRYKSRPRGQEEDDEEFKEPEFTSSYQEYTAGYWRR